jgi:hypothetical protein
MRIRNSVIYLSLLLGVGVPLVGVGAPEKPLHLLLGQLHVEHLAQLLHLQHNYGLLSINQKERWKKPGVTKICRLSWLTNSTLEYEPKCGGGGLRGLSHQVQL